MNLEFYCVKLSVVITKYSINVHSPAGRNQQRKNNWTGQVKDEIRRQARRPPHQTRNEVMVIRIYSMV